MSTTDPKRPGDGPGTRDGTTGPAGPDELDTGRHAVQRPTPTPPAPDPAPYPAARVSPPSATAAPGTTPGPHPDRPGPGASHGADAAQDARRTASPDDGDEELFPDPHAPRTPHAGTHVLGALVGLVLAPFAVGLLLLGQSRILVVQVDGWDASLELLGIVLVSSGAVLLAALLVLGLWSAAVPLTAGLLVAALGGLQLYAPGIARMTTLDVVGTSTWDRAVTQATVAGTSGTTIVAGVMLLTGGVTIALARRHGVHLGEFRERNRTT
ncbi:hypothetical protein [Cellulomonas sp. S1-8]|uniref:hypothetical protein n=1 Tax=Cellulomonas sp. S1-8 TaxID=2904790 RepID=UPI0022445B0E|nr:hypothetical protein [Cellulomonas sp. S1-8]UZN02475.1 hypothetical protein OKX07_15640 [Cellulomonas sp. S1-8]